MAITEWSDELSVGVYILDADHKLLVSLIKQFNNAVDCGQSSKKIAKILNRLYDYTDFYFIREEAIMNACGCSEIENHHKVHVNLCQQMQEICDRYANDHSKSLCNEIKVFLDEWLTKHVIGQDKSYAVAMFGKELEIAGANASLMHQYSVAESGEATDVY